MLLGYLALLLSAIIGGLSPVMLKLGSSEIPPITLSTFRFVIGSLILLPFYVHQHTPLTKRQMRNLVIKSLFFAGNMVFFSYAISYTTAIMSQILYTSVPVVVSVLAHFLVHEKFSANKALGLFIAFIGILFLIGQSLSSNTMNSLGTPYGNIILLLAIGCWAMYIVISRRLSAHHSAVTMGFFSVSVTAIVLLFIAPFELAGHTIGHITFIGFGSMFFLGILSSAVFFPLFQFGIAKTNAFSASLTSYLGPVFAGLGSTFLLGERITFSLIIGGLFILFGAFLASSYDYLKKYAKSMLQ